jgi:ketosteroid isomerase-like protein
MPARKRRSNTPHADIEMENREIRAALDRHRAASDANDFEAEHQIYQEVAVLEYPQSGERIRGRHNIQASRFAQPNKKRFTVRRILGAADLWITELVLTYDGQPSYTVSIMEFRDGKVVRETQYFGDRFEPACDGTSPVTKALQLCWIESCGPNIVLRNIAGLSSGPNGPGTLLLTGGRLVRNSTIAEASDFVSAA